MLGEKTDPDRNSDGHSDGHSGVQNAGRTRSSIDGFLESCRELRGQLQFRQQFPEMPVGGRTICVWGLISIVVAGLHLSLFVPEFRETWYAPLHFLWVVAGASGVSWWCLRGRRSDRRRWTALVQAVAFVVVSCGISWAVARVPWGSGVAREARLPLSGALLVFASFFLMAVSLFLARRAGLWGRPAQVSRKADPQEG